MRHRRTSILVGLAATFIMCTGITMSSASNLSISSTTFRYTWQALRITGEGGLEGTVSCPVTMEGSFHASTMPKTAGALIGYITTARLNEGACTGGTATILRLFPWHYTYAGFGGTLPRISRIIWLAHGWAVLVAYTPGFPCLFIELGVERVNVINNVEAGGAVTSAEPDPTKHLSLGEGSFCPPEVRFSGVAQVTQLGSTTRTTVRLI